MVQKLSWQRIHEAIHNGSSAVFLGGARYPVEISKTNECRFIRYTDSTLGPCMFMEQNPHKISDHAKRARDGETLTWVIPDNKNVSWKLIDDKVEKPLKVPGREEVQHGT